jgi:hypothetical protein
MGGAWWLSANDSCENAVLDFWIGNDARPDLTRVPLAN